MNLFAYAINAYRQHRLRKGYEWAANALLNGELSYKELHHLAELVPFMPRVTAFDQGMCEAYLYLGTRIDEMSK